MKSTVDVLSVRAISCEVRGRCGWVLRAFVFVCGVDGIIRREISKNSQALCGSLHLVIPLASLDRTWPNEKTGWICITVLDKSKVVLATLHHIILSSFYSGGSSCAARPSPGTRG